MCQHSVTLNLIYLCVYFFVGMCKLLYRLVRFRGSHTCAGGVIEHQQQQEEEKQLLRAVIDEHLVWPKGGQG